MSDLSNLYPFLGGQRPDPTRLDAALMRSIEDKARESREMVASSPNRDSACSPRRAPSPASTTAVAGCSPWATAARAAMPRTSRWSSCIPHRWPAGARRDQPRCRCRDVVSAGQRSRLRACVPAADHGTGRAGDGLIGISTSGTPRTCWRRRKRRRWALSPGLCGGDGGRMQSSGRSIIVWWCRRCRSIAPRSAT